MGFVEGGGEVFEIALELATIGDVAGRAGLAVAADVGRDDGGARGSQGVCGGVHAEAGAGRAVDEEDFAVGVALVAAVGEVGAVSGGEMLEGWEVGEVDRFKGLLTLASGLGRVGWFRAMVAVRMAAGRRIRAARMMKMVRMRFAPGRRRT